MTEPDTIKLLRECDAGIKMGTASIGEVLEKTTNEKLKKLLEICNPCAVWSRQISLYDFY